MTQEQENFYRHSTVIVDETKDSFLHLLEFHLTNQGITLQRFIEINGHDIYHLCFNCYPCCQCPPGTRTGTRGSRVLHPPQLDILFDKTGSKLPGHNPGSKSAPNCCCPVNPNLQLHDLDFTLARFLLVNFTTLVPQGSPERSALDFLANSRNHSFAHAKEGKISNSEYQKSMADVEASLLVLAKVYNKGAETKQRLRDIAKQPLNIAICLQLQNTLLQQCQLEETIKRLLPENILPECLTRDLEDIRVIEGNDAKFEFWTKEHNIIAEWLTEDNKTDVYDKFVIEASGVKHTLVVRNADLTDRGIYTAKFEGYERSARLEIDEYFTKNMRSTYEYIEGDIAELSCAVLEDNVTAHWEKDGVGVQHGDIYTITDEGKNHKLTIQHINLQDAGDYCVKICDRMRSTSLNVKEYFTKPLGTMICMEGETVQFECEVLDDSQTALWFKDGSEVITSDRYNVERDGKLHRLVVNNTRLNDVGKYSVKIKHCVRHSQLIVQEMPNAIQQLSIEDKSLYMDIIKSGTETRYHIRIVIIGENGVGKTCLLRRLLKQSTTGVQSTDGIDMHRCKIRLRDGKWIFDEVSDKKKELLTRIKMARHASILEEETLQETTGSLGASGLQDDDGSENSNRESPNTSHNTGNLVRRKKKPGILEYIKDIFHRTKSKDQSLTTIPNLPEVSQLKMESNSQPKPINTITGVLTEKVLQGLDDLINDVENIELPADKFVECGILDFAGEKEYYATHPIFLNPNALHLLVANIMKDVKPITTEDGFDKIGEYIDFWLDTIHSCGVEETKQERRTEFLYPPTIIVCTRIDECRDLLQIRKDNFRKQLLHVLKDEDKKKHVTDICYVSNTESDEVDFDVLRDSIFKFGKQVKTFVEKLPLKWIRLEQALNILREAELNILSWPDIVELSSKCLIDSENEINLFLKYQHKVGSVIYFENLKEYIILNQKWLANAFRCLVSNKFDSNLKLTDEWKTLEDTGKLEYSLIVKLFDKEPELDFNKHSGHILNVMEIFNIIVKLTTLTENGQRQTLPTYYLPCMISEKASVTDIIDKFNAKKDNCKRTPWLCIEFDFMPFDFFNHILCYYINQYALCTEPQTGRMAIYHGMGVFFLDNTKFRKCILCFCKNTVALQIWQRKNVEKGKCKVILEELMATIERVKDRFETRRVFNTVKSKCSDGNIHISAGRHSYSELLDSDDYFCEEHGDHHKTRDFFQTWFEDYTETKQVVQGVQKAHEETTYKEPVCITFPSMEEDDEKQIKSLQMSISSSTKCDPFDTEFIVPANIAKEAHFYSTEILTDFGNISRLYDGYFVECIEHNQSRNTVGPDKGPTDMASVSNRYIVDCIIDKRLDAKRMEIGKPVSFEQLLNTKDKPEYTVLASIKTHIRSGATLSATLSQKIIIGAINRPNSMLCRLIISLHKQLTTSIPVYLHALELAMEQSEMDYAKALAWFITRIFVKHHIHSYQNIRDIWPAFVCNCKENSDTIFCSKKICIVIESTSIDSDLSLPVIFKSVDIKLLQHKDDDESEAKFINNKIKHIKHIFITKEMSVSGEVAEKLFKKHSKLTIITNSLCKSKGYHGKQNQEVVEGPCIQLYCRVKGLIPVGEEHFPQYVCGLQTDIVEGLSSLMGNIRIGDMVGRNGKVGTLGGFVQVRGDLAFLTCCHVIADEASLAPVNISFDDSKPVLIEYFPWCKMQDGTYVRKHPYVCGRIREAPAFETDNSEKVSLDAVLVTLKKKVITIEQNNFIANGDDLQFSMAYLGLKTEYLNENCLDYNQFCYGIPRPHVQVISSGAISGIFYTYPEMSKDKEEGTSIDLQSFQDSYIAVDKEYNQTFTSWIKEILQTDSENDMPIDVGRFIEEKCGIGTSSETKGHLTEVIKRVVDRLKVDSNLEINIENLLQEEIRNKSTNNATIFGGTHIQTLFLAKTADRRDIRRLSRRMYNQIYITEVPFKPGDSGTCIYVKEPEICGCVGMAIADHSGGGCIATPIMEILKHFKIRFIHS